MSFVIQKTMLGCLHLNTSPTKRTQPPYCIVPIVKAITMERISTRIINSPIVYPFLMFFLVDLEWKGSPTAGSLSTTRYRTRLNLYSTTPHLTQPILWYNAPYQTDTAVHDTERTLPRCWTWLNFTTQTQHISGQNMSRLHLATPILNCTDGYSTLLSPNITAPVSNANSTLSHGAVPKLCIA